MSELEKILQNKINILGYSSDLNEVKNGSIHYIFLMEKYGLVMKVRSDHAREYPDVAINPQDIQKEINIIKCAHNLSSTDICIPKVINYEVNEPDQPSWMIMEAVGRLTEFYNLVLAEKGVTNDELFKLGEIFSIFHKTIQDPKLLKVINDENPSDYFEKYFEHKVGKIEEEKNKELYEALHECSKYVVHGNLAPKNMIFKNNALSIVDWEYAHIGSIELELALFIVALKNDLKCSLPEGAIDYFIAGYCNDRPNSGGINENLVRKTVSHLAV